MSIETLTGYHVIDDSVFGDGAPLHGGLLGRLEDNIELLERCETSRMIASGVSGGDNFAADVVPDGGSLMRAFPLVPIRPLDTVTMRMCVISSTIDLILHVVPGGPPEAGINVADLETAYDDGYSPDVDLVAVNSPSAATWVELTAVALQPSARYSVLLYGLPPTGVSRNVSLLSFAVWGDPA